MRQYYHVRAADAQKLPFVIEEILDLAANMELNNDIGICFLKGRYNNTNDKWNDSNRDRNISNDSKERRRAKAS